MVGVDSSPGMERVRVGIGRSPEASRVIKPENPSVNFQVESACIKNPDRVLQISTFSNTENGYAGIIDGVNGLTSGQEASFIANQTMGINLERKFQKDAPLDQKITWVRGAIEVANIRLCNANSQSGSEKSATAAVACLHIAPGERKLIVGNVGDCRVYTFSDGNLEQIGKDDNHLAADVQKGKVSPARAVQIQYVVDHAGSQEDLQNLTADERQYLVLNDQDKKVLGRDLTLNPTLHTIDIAPGTRVLLCSNGIPANLASEEISQILATNPDDKIASQALVEAARARSEDPAHPRHRKDDFSAMILSDQASTANKQDNINPDSSFAVLIGSADGSLDRRDTRDSGENSNSASTRAFVRPKPDDVRLDLPAMRAVVESNGQTGEPAVDQSATPDKPKVYSFTKKTGLLLKTQITYDDPNDHQPHTLPIAQIDVSNQRVTLQLGSQQHILTFEQFHALRPDLLN